MLKKNWMNKILALSAGAAIVAGGFFGGAALFSGTATEASAATVNLTKNESEAPKEQLNFNLPDYSGLVDKCLPSVVSITNVIEVTSSGSGLYYDFFFPGYGRNGQNQMRPTEITETEAYGSGVIIGKTDEELLIVTNNHVAVTDYSTGESYFYSYSYSTKELKVTFADGTELPAVLKGADADADIAVIAVDISAISDETMNTIAVATIGNSDEMKIGNGVMAIGNALGRGQTATFGHISALERDVTTEDGITRTMMQTDAAINNGNSGGGLFNTYGELVGINSAKANSSYADNIGYAIPITSVEDLITDLMNEKARTLVDEENRGYLGIYGADVPATYVSAYGIPQGAMVTQIMKDSPAENGGLHVSDIITAVGSRKITSYEGLRSALSYYAAGDTVELTIQRAAGPEYEEQVLSITLAGLDDIEPVEAESEAEAE